MRRSAWIRWLPPIDSMSPSPPITHTCRSGRAQRDAGRDRRRAPVDRVHAVGVHVVRQAGRAADARHEHEVFGLDAGLGQQELDRGEDAVVAAARAPAHFLVGLEVLARQLHRRAVAFAVAVTHDSINSRICCFELGGPERERRRPACSSCASTRNSARTSFDELAEVHLGHEHLAVAARTTSPRSAGNGFRCRRCTCAIRRPRARTRRTAGGRRAPRATPRQHERARRRPRRRGRRRGCRARCPAIFAARTRVIVSWFSGS